MAKKVTIPQLKEQLRLFGAKLSGNKAVLQQRVQNWKENQLGRTLFDVPKIISEDSNCFPVIKTYQPLEKLSSKTINWVTKSLIELYFQERMAGKGFEKGRKLFMCQFLKNCRFYQEGDNIYLIATCCAEMKKALEYDVNVHLDSRQCLLMKSQCQCPAGVGPGAACKHVSALLNGIEFYAVTGNVKQIPSCTSTAQQWHKPKATKGRNLQKCTINEIMNIKSPVIIPNSQVTDYFLNGFSKAKGESALIKGRYCNMFGFLNDHNYCTERLETILLNKLNDVKLSEIPKLEKKTRTNKRLWHQLRTTRITASIAHDVARTCRSKRFATSFLNNHFLNKSILTKAMKWGIANEDTALKTFSDIMGEKFTKCGTFIDRERNYISATPDGINASKDKIVEIKCPYSVRFGKPEEVQYLRSGMLKSTHRYYTQIQIQMHVTKVHSCDFIVWTPHGIYIQGIKYDADFVDRLLNDCDYYYRNVFCQHYFKTKNCLELHTKMY